jgi:NADP-dependent 3-hydroxy acid dehydrogenase YdfG
MAKLKPLNRQVLVITGASSGIGLATALLAAGRGTRVVLAAQCEDGLRTIAAQITRAVGQVLVAAVDVGVREQVDALARVSIEHFGRIDAWVNAAGLAMHGPLEEAEEDDSHRLFDTNFWGVVNGSLAALPYLRASSGTLINIGNDVADVVLPGQGMYAATKFAVKGFTAALRVEIEELEGAPVRIALIEPAVVGARKPAANEPEPAVPQISEGLVAEAILRVAVDGVCDIRGDDAAHVNAQTFMALPEPDDRLAPFAHRHHRQDLPRWSPHGGALAVDMDADFHAAGARAQGC